MAPLKAVVKNGRLVVDEPTELAEGTELELIAMDGDFDAEERARVLRAIDEGLDDLERGEHSDGFSFVAQLRTSRAATDR